MRGSTPSWGRLTWWSSAPEVAPGKGDFPRVSGQAELRRTNPSRSFQRMRTRRVLREAPRGQRPRVEMRIRAAAGTPGSPPTVRSARHSRQAWLFFSRRRIDSSAPMAITLMPGFRRRPDATRMAALSTISTIDTKVTVNPAPCGWRPVRCPDRELHIANRGLLGVARSA